MGVTDTTTKPADAIVGEAPAPQPPVVRGQTAATAGADKEAATAELNRQLQDKEDHPEWLEVELEVVPGISAMQAAASRCGAILGHDFCTISLSDLLTPWETIVKRLHAAGAGDFVVSFYNPRSKQRDWQIEAARDILLEYRPAATPVILGRQLSREDESINIVTLGELDAADVDMFTLVSVGNRESRMIETPQQRWVYTPRGYRQKL